MTSEIKLPDTATQDTEDAKQLLRDHIRDRRKRRTDKQLQELSLSIRDQVLSCTSGAHSVAFYVSVEHEPATLPAIEALDAAGVRVLLPKLGPGLSRSWAYFTGVDDLQALSPNRPLEPTGEALDHMELASVDVIITPALAVDMQGNRLGQGGGWYDRALDVSRASAPVYALVFADEVITSRLLPVASHDVPVDGILTPERVLWLSDNS
ncbi:MAG: 5-formyltetrahydrofolate cyclo-ligase [Actinomycetaceae bacterium]|nr:5-formyltetrahydrofolate cyclo-ligase [Actinomycetaceae bacterium]